MLSGIANYFFGTSSAEEPQQDEVEKVPEKSSVDMETELDTTRDQDWVIVDYSDCSFRKRTSQEKTSCVTNCGVTGCYGDTSDSGSSSPMLPSTPDSSLSPVSKSRHCYVRTNHGVCSEAWLLTPPPCFTAGNKDKSDIKIDPMENLLIEHPSMSVYKRSGSEGESSDMSESSTEQTDVVPMRKPRSQAVQRQAPRRVRTVTARAQLLAQVECIKSAQRVKLQHASRPYCKKNLIRSNKVREVRAQGKSQNHRNRVSRPSGQMCGRVTQRKQ